jgi:trk system potassium uptake protein TrkH
MRIVPILTVLGFLILAVGMTMLAAVGVSAYYQEPDVKPILFSALISIGVGTLLLVFLKRLAQDELRPREGFAIVTFGWIVVPLFGSLPFLLSGAIPDFTNAYFETMSGFTTTGASILMDVEKLSHGLLFWRSMTHWLGGMGIIVLSLAVLPLLGIGGMQLFKAEVAGPTKDKLTPRVAETARLLWGLYVLVTVAETIMLTAGGMSLFDAVCHSFATIASGGFSTKNTSIGYYDSAYIDAVVTFFMFVAGTNFALHYSALRGRLGSYLRDNEFVFFLASFVVAAVIVAGVTARDSFEGDFLLAIRYSTFNVMSVMSCTGFATNDFALWAPLAQLILLFLLFPGACAGSTGGAVKNVRVLLLLKAAVNEFKKLIHPQAIVRVRLNGKAIEQDVLFTVAGFIILYLMTFATGSILMTGLGLDLITSLSAVASCMANCGPGLGSVGPMANYAHLPDLAKWVLDACMLVGRLELFTVFVLFSRSFWRS